VTRPRFPRPRVELLTAPPPDRDRSDVDEPLYDPRTAPDPGSAPTPRKEITP
jgi:hypothetical protein